MSHPNGYTKEDIKRILGSSWPTIPEGHETGNQMRRRKGREMREGKRSRPVYNAKKTGTNFDENGKYIYPEGLGFRYTDYLRDNPDSTEASSYGNKVS
tara:strand:- start:576 stop:869 length:294 start_codon:yes stop_codon:yes gene_type:complete